MIVCVYTALQYLPLVYVAAVSNIGPLMIALFSYFIFQKGLSPLDITVLVISFVGVTFLITGSVNN
jgi:drug/metabolite transporter (DMT)-like permease